MKRTIQKKRYEPQSKNVTQVYPTLYIIAGPNGAGKSTNSKVILAPYNLIAFDWDMEFDKLWKAYSFDPIIEQGVSDQVTNTFIERFNTALENKVDFAYETNFHSLNDITRINKAKKFGYKICIVFFYMQNFEQCITRVKDRVNNGGHFIPDKTVKERFYNGLKNLNTHFKNFDNLRIYNAWLYWDLSLIVEIEKGEIEYIDYEFFKTDTQLLNMKNLGKSLKLYYSKKI